MNSSCPFHQSQKSYYSIEGIGTWLEGRTRRREETRHCYCAHGQKHWLRSHFGLQHIYPKMAVAVAVRPTVSSVSAVIPAEVSLYFLCVVSRYTCYVWEAHMDLRRSESALKVRNVSLNSGYGSSDGAINARNGRAQGRKCADIHKGDDFL